MAVVSGAAIWFEQLGNFWWHDGRLSGLAVGLTYQRHNNTN
jgi:hypothetical protein